MNATPQTQPARIRARFTAELDGEAVTGIAVRDHLGIRVVELVDGAGRLVDDELHRDPRVMRAARRVA